MSLLLVAGGGRRGGRGVASGAASQPCKSGVGWRVRAAVVLSCSLTRVCACVSRWDFGGSYLIMDSSMGRITEAMAQNINVRPTSARAAPVAAWTVKSQFSHPRRVAPCPLPAYVRAQIRVGCPIVHVDYSGSGDRRVLLTCQDGRRLRCRAAVITVPLRILQDQVLTFSPALPAPKQEALRRIKMGNVVKVILGFSDKFWTSTDSGKHQDMYDCVCTDSFVPEFWMLKYPATNKVRRRQDRRGGGAWGRVGGEPSWVACGWHGLIVRLMRACGCARVWTVQATGLAQHVIVGFMAGTHMEASAHLPHDEVRRWVWGALCTRERQEWSARS